MIRGLTQLGRMMTGALNQVRGRVAILLYHRIAQHDTDPQLLCVAPKHFEQHLVHLRRNFQVMSLTQLVGAVREGNVPRRSVVITFDDGYVDNLWYAKPLLERFECPATLFVVSGFIDQDREMVSDELERLILKPAILPKALKLTIAEKSYSWEIDTPGQLPVKWDVTQTRYPTSRHRCYYDLHRLIRPMSAMEREAILDNLRNWADDPRSVRDDYRIMNANELLELAVGNLIDIGAHTISHLFLSAQPEEIQRHEVGDSKQQLETLLARPVPFFAYPYGGRDAVSPITERIVQEVGFLDACANIPGLASNETNIFLFPRFLIRDWNNEELSKQLHVFFSH